MSLALHQMGNEAANRATNANQEPNPDLNVVQIYQYNNRNISIDLTKVPIFSEKAKQILESLGFQLPPLFSPPAPLIENIQSIEEIFALLNKSTSSSTRRKLYGLLKTAASVAVAGTTISVVATGSGVVGPVVGIVGLVAHVALSVWFWDRGIEAIQTIEANAVSRSCLAKCEIDDWGDHLPAIIGPGTFMPAYEAFSQQARIEGVFREKQTELAGMLNEYREHNMASLPRAYQFCRISSQNLSNSLNQRIESMGKDLASMRQFQNRSLTGEQDLADKIENFKQVKKEVDDMKTFFKQFDSDGLVDDLKEMS